MDIGRSVIRSVAESASRNLHVESYNRATALSLISMLDGAGRFGAKLVGRVADASLRVTFVVMGIVPLVAYAVTRLRDADVRRDEGGAAPAGTDGVVG